MKTNSVKILVVIFTIAIMLAGKNFVYSQAGSITATPQTTPWIWSDYVDPLIADDKVFIFCSPDQNGDTLLGVLNVQGGYPNCTYVWGKFNPALQVFEDLGIPVPSGPSSTVDDLTSGFYQVIITCNAGLPSETTICRRAHVFVNETVVEFDPIDPGCQSFDITGGIIDAVADFTIYDPPPTPFVVDSTTNVTVCFWVDHSYVSDLGFYLIGPSGGRIDLMPSIAGWTSSGTALDASVVLGCDPLMINNTNANSGNDYVNFCFSSALPAGNPNSTPCIANLSTPVTGTFASCEGWSEVWGDSASAGGWQVQIFDCVGADIGNLQRVTISFEGQGQCGNTVYSYDSGAINEAINDGACDSINAAKYTVPLKPTFNHTITNEVTAHWESYPVAWDPAWGSTDFDQNPVPSIDPEPLQSTEFCLVIEDHLYDTLGLEIMPNAFYTPCEPSICFLYNTLPTNPDIVNPPLEVCQNDPPFQLQAVEWGGAWASSCGNYPAGCITQGGWFFPSNAFLGPNTITYAFGGVCAADTTITIQVVDAPVINAVVDTICNAANTHYMVEVTLSGGNAGGYTAINTTTGSPAGAFGAVWQSLWIPSGSVYSYTFSDNNNCDPSIVTGIHNCSCTSNAGNMYDPLLGSQLVELCAFDITSVGYQPGTYSLDGNDGWVYILHTEPFGYLGNIIHIDNDPNNNQLAEFFFIDTLMNYGQTYYVSHVVGNNLGTSTNYIVDLVNDGCLSVSPGRPVVWYEFPTANAGTNEQICGKTIELNADTPSVGFGQWTGVGISNINWYPNFDEPNVTVTVPYYDTNQWGCDENTEYTFRWTVANGPCAIYDDVKMTFKPIPVAFAGNDQLGLNAVCGLETDLNAIYSLCVNQAGVAEGYWSGGDGLYSNPQNPITEVNVYQPGIYTFKWTEFNGDCQDWDYITVEFLEDPIVNANYDDSICGNSYPLDAITTMGVGFWEGPSGTTFTCDTCPSTFADVIYPPGATQYTATFTWNESNGVCEAEDDVIITYAVTPVATAGVDQLNVCGTATFLDADVLGFEYALGTWKTDFVGVQFADNHDPLTNVTIPNTGSMNGSNSGSFGDSSYVDVHLTWVLDNVKCVSEDELIIRFHQTPIANAGPDSSVCGLTYTMFAEESIGSSKGKWTVVQNPLPAPIPPNWSDDEDPNATVTVAGEGEWVFKWKEDNVHLQSCTSSDEVMVYFIEMPDIDAGNDRFVCGQEFNMEAIPSTGNGVWSQYGSAITDIFDPNTLVNYGNTGQNDSVLYVWQEYNEDPWGWNFCSEKDSVYIVFMVIPEPVTTWFPGQSTNFVCGKKEENILVAIPPTSGIVDDALAFWVNDDADFFPSSSASDPDSVKVFNYGLQSFYWRIENWVGDSVCAVNSDTILLDFIEQPVAEAGALTDTSCGQFYQLGAEFSVSSGNLEGIWYSTSPNITFWDFVSIVDGDTTLVPGDSLPNGWVMSPVVPDLTPDTYDFIWNEINYGVLDTIEYCSDNDMITVTFAPQPHGSSNIIYHPHCIGYEAKVKAKDDAEIVSYDWSDLDDGIITAVDPGGGTVANPEKGPIYVQWNNAAAGENHYVRLITTNRWECTSPADADTVFEPFPLPVEPDIEPAKCGEPDGAVTLEAHEDYPFPQNYEWIENDIHVFGDTTLAEQLALETGDYYYKVNGLSYNIRNYDEANNLWINPDNVRCTDTLMIHVADTGYIAAVARLVTLNDTIDGVAPQELEFVNVSYDTDSNYVSQGFYHFRTVADSLPASVTPDADFQWRFYRIPIDSVPDLGGPIIIQPYEEPEEFDGETVIEEINPIMTFELGGYYKFKLTATSEFGCRDESLGGYFYVEEKEELEPGVNVFTPNGDTQNDFFEFKAHSLVAMEGRIFDRWGKQVFEWTWNEDDQTPNPGWWDGNLENGQPASAGVYYYVIKGTGLKGKDFSGKEYTGFVHLIRE